MNMRDNPPDNAAEVPPIRAIRREMLGARDQQILRIVAVVDALANRGEADRLVEPVRPRLAALRPPRPLTLRRLLFRPVDPLIVPPNVWRREQLAIPRTALTPIGFLVADALGPSGGRIEARLAGLTTEDEDHVRAIGAELWRLGAAVLRTAAPPDDWVESTGLSVQDFEALARIIAAGLAAADNLEPLLADAQANRPLPDVEIAAMLEAALADKADFAIILALLTAGTPRPNQVLQIADDLAARAGDVALRREVDRAFDTAVDGIEASLSADVPVGAAAAALRDIVSRFEDIETACERRPSRKPRVTELRRTLDGANQARFTKAIDAQLLEPATEIASASDDAIRAMETAARDLRRFESIARRIGGAEHYDRSLRSAAGQLNPQADDSQQTRVDRVRLIEILAGPEAAMAAGGIKGLD